MILVDVKYGDLKGVAKVHPMEDGDYDIEYFIIHSPNGGKIKLRGFELDKAEKYGFDPTEIRMTIEEALE